MDERALGEQLLALVVEITRVRQAYARLQDAMELVRTYAPMHADEIERLAYRPAEWRQAVTRLRQMSESIMTTPRARHRSSHAEADERALRLTEAAAMIECIERTHLIPREELSVKEARLAEMQERMTALRSATRP